MSPGLQAPLRAALRWSVGLLLLVPACIALAQAAAPPVEERVALVIGNATYLRDPLDNPVNDARLVAQALRQAGFAVAEHENLRRAEFVEALREFGRRLHDNSVAVVYYAGHGLQLRDHNYLIPVDAEIRGEDEIPIAGLDLGFLLNRMSAARSRVNIVILDACRNNPFAGRNGVKAQGLAQMDAPVNTLLAFATAPGKLAADGGGGAHGVYATHLARQLLAPGLPVEQMFKRVREGVVRDTRELQVPWESSSLQGEFAFVAAPRPATAVAQAAAPGPLVLAARPQLLPHSGDQWRYRVQDRFRLGDLYVTATVREISAEGVVEAWTSTADDTVRTAVAPLAPGFHALPGWTLSPPEFAPYLQAAGELKPGPLPGVLQRRVEQVMVPLQAAIEGDEDVTVGAGRFRATRLLLRGQAVAKARGGAPAEPVIVEQTVWYAPQAKRIVKATVNTRVGAAVLESATFELVSFQLGGLAN